MSFRSRIVKLNTSRRAMPNQAPPSVPHEDHHACDGRQRGQVRFVHADGLRRRGVRSLRSANSWGARRSRSRRAASARSPCAGSCGSPLLIRRPLSSGIAADTKLRCDILARTVVLVPFTDEFGLVLTSHLSKAGINAGLTTASIRGSAAGLRADGRTRSTRRAGASRSRSTSPSCGKSS